MRRSLVLAMSLGLVLTACGGDGTSGSEATTPASTPAEESPATADDGAGDGYGGAPAGTTTGGSTADATDAPGGTVLAGSATLTSASSDHGTIVVDGEGRAVYLFQRDDGETSSCTGQCAQTWPPLLVDGAATVEGDLDPDRVGTTTREDGGMQVTYGGHPLYHYSGDEQPGETNGQGVGDVWFLLDPMGEAITGD